MSRGRFWLVSTGGGVLALVAAVVAVLVGTALLQVEAGTPEPLPASGELVVEDPALTGSRPVLVYAPAASGGRDVAAADLGCVVLDPEGEQRSRMDDFLDPDLSVDGVTYEALVSSGDVLSGDTVRCDGPAATTVDGLAVGVGTGGSRTGGVVAIGFGVLAAGAGLVFLVVGLVLRRSSRSPRSSRPSGQR